MTIVQGKEGKKTKRDSERYIIAFRLWERKNRKKVAYAVSILLFSFIWAETTIKCKQMTKLAKWSSVKVTPMNLTKTNFAITQQGK